MEFDKNSVNVFYNPTLGQIVVTHEDVAVSVFEKTPNPHKRGFELIKIALAQTGNVSACSRIEVGSQFNDDGSTIDASTEKPATDPPLPTEEGLNP